MSDIYPLPEVSTVVAWATAAVSAPTDLERAAAKGCLVVAFARAKARAEGVDETKAVQAALDATRERAVLLEIVR